MVFFVCGTKMSPPIHMAFQGHTLTGLVWPSIGSIHFRCGSHLTKFCPLSTPALFIKLCCLSSAVLYISVNVPHNICLCVCLSLHPPADMFSFYVLWALYPHAQLDTSYWFVWTSPPLPFHISGKSWPFLSSSFFPGPAVLAQMFKVYSLVQRFSTLII